jgi:hypothetical protein
MTAETYLGDGLYASFDGWQIMLRAPRLEGDHWVGLEPAVVEALVEFVGGLRALGKGDPPVLTALLDAANRFTAP